jgi:hypothetical protein
MRFGTSLFAALVLTGTVANAVRAQGPGASTAAPGPGLNSSYTGPYSGRGPGLTYRQDTSSLGPYSGRFSSASRPAPTQTGSYSSSRPAELIPQTGKGRVLGDATRADAGRSSTGGAGPGPTRYRYVRISIAGNAIQAIVIP